MYKFSTADILQGLIIFLLLEASLLIWES